jgi:hypothetical protein
LKHIKSALSITTVLFISATLSFAGAATENKKTYKEMEFIHTFKGKNQKFVLDTLGKPTRKQSPVKPNNADGYVGKAVPNDTKVEAIEMWYYANLVSYNSTQTFKQTEITFINDVVSNMTFVNK